jgi:transposase
MSEQIKQWIGIDVCKDYLDIAIHPEGKTLRLANDAPGQAELVHRLSSYQVEGIVLEATGGIERAVMSALEAAGYQTRRVNPLQIRHCLDSLNRRGTRRARIALPEQQANWQKQTKLTRK